MADNWGFVFAAYGIAAVALIGYWRRLARRSRELARFKARQEKEAA